MLSQVLVCQVCEQVGGLEEIRSSGLRNDSGIPPSAHDDLPLAQTATGEFLKFRRKSSSGAKSRESMAAAEAL